MKSTELIEHIAGYQDQLFRELWARRESMSWAVDKLRRLKRNLEYCAASCEEIAQALDEETNPRLKETGAAALKEYADNFSKWSGMSTAQVDPHPEPPPSGNERDQFMCNEVPYCCGRKMTRHEDGHFQCETCGHCVRVATIPKTWE